MRNLKTLFFIIFICIFFLCPQKAHAGKVSDVIDNGINYTAKATYNVTKYTLKAGWFVIKETAKGIKVISTSIFNGTKDAFCSAPKTEKFKPVNKNPNSPNSIYVLPPAPKLN